MQNYTYTSEVIKTMLSATLNGIKGGIEAANLAYPGAFSLARDRGIEYRLAIDPETDIRIYIEPSTDAHRAALGKG